MLQLAAPLSKGSGQGGVTPAAGTADQKAVAYLGTLQRFIAEVSAASNAIACNTPVRFLESAHRQDSLALELVTLKGELWNRVPEFKEAVSPALAVEIDEVERFLRRALRSYYTLLQRSAKSIAMLSRLHDSYTESYPCAIQSNVVKATWSCEG